MSSVSTVRGGPRGVVTDGLILNLDAGNPQSYPGFGTTWFDLTINRNNGTLLNGPTFSSANGGIIVFDGTNDLVSANIQQYLSFTISIWVYPISGTGLFQYGNDPGGHPILLLDYNLSGNLRVYSFNYYQTFNSVLSLNNWNQVVVAASQVGATKTMYVNGFSIATNSYSAVIQVGGITLAYQGYIGFGNCRIASTQMYNRALSAQEVLQNYNATKTRFGL